MVLEKSSFDIRLVNLVSGSPLLEALDGFKFRALLLVAADQVNDNIVQVRPHAF